MALKTARGDEAAAIAAAVARFEAELSGGAAAEPEAAVGAWQRVALLEGVSAKEPVEDPGGGSQWLS
jgi:hypothetical protein